MNIQFPRSYPDEIIISTATRFHILDDSPTAANTYKTLFDSKPYRLTSMIPPFLERLALKLPGTPQEEVKKLLEENTLYPLLKLFNGTRMENIESCDLSEFKILPAPKRLVGGAVKTYLCPDCVIDDIKEFGIPYIHRAHQVPGVIVCHKHGKLLLDSCSECGCPFETIREFVTVPWHGCVCDKDVSAMTSGEGIEHIDAAVGYANFSYDLLQKTDLDVSAKVLSETYRYKAISLGHKFGNSMSRKDVMEAIEGFYGVELLSYIDNAYAKGKVRGWHTHFVEVATHTTPVSRHLLTAYYLFRDVESFVSALQETEERLKSEAKRKNSIHKNPKNSFSKKRVYKRKKRKKSSKTIEVEKSSTLQFLEKAQLNNPNYDLNDFWENHRAKMRKLVSDNKDEFERFKELISAGEDNAEPGISIDIGCMNEDSILANRVEMVANELYRSTKKPEKMTKHGILNAAGINAYKYIYVDGYTKLKQKIEECIESQWHYYARRILWTKLKIGNREYPVSEITIESGVNHSVAMRLDSFFKDATKNIPFEQGSIMKILNKYRIELDWEGPDPDNVYYLNGRNYVPVSNR